MKSMYHHLILCITAAVLLSLSTSFAQAQHSQSVVEPGAELVKLADGFSFAEGPVSDSAGNLWFSDYGNDKIHYFSAHGTLQTVIENVGGPIGLYFDKSGTLYICSAKDHRIKKLPRIANNPATIPDAELTLNSYSDRFEGNLFNSPNDIWVDSKGGVYFTDPRFAPLPEEVEQDGFHIYYILPGSKKIIRAAEDLNKPNGIVGSPDGKIVYVTDTPEDKTFVYTVQEDGGLTDKRLFANEGYDGMTVDSLGNVYSAMQNSIEVYDPDGKKLDSIPVPDKPNNVCFGGVDGKTLFITARVSVYSLRMRIPGLKTGL